MFIAAFPTGALEANCYVLATGSGAECVVIDPGEGAFDTVAEICRDNALTPAGVCVTHGHLDHVADVARVCGHWDIPCWVHPADQPLLSEPMRALPEAWRPVVEEMVGGTTLPAPACVEPYQDRIALAGLTFGVSHAPGHSAGSSVLQLDVDADDEDGPATLVFTGDVLFAGSVGRTDLPGGDAAAMAATLSRLSVTIPTDAVLLPGHGPRTTMSAELASNPYLRTTGTD